jgi:hypothetical protein
MQAHSLRLREAEKLFIFFRVCAARAPPLKGKCGFIIHPFEQMSLRFQAGMEFPYNKIN